jgi:site-specific recombinase XerD
VRIGECVDIYVRIKRESGFSYDSSNLRLRSFVRRVGDIPLEQISLRQVEDFMDAPRASDALWQCKYGLLRHFFEYWQSRYPLEQIPMPVKRRALPPRISFPHIYSQAQVQRLLTAADQMRNRRPGAIDVITLRTFVLFLYGTGCLVGEALRIQLRDVDLIRQPPSFAEDALGVAGRYQYVQISPRCCVAMCNFGMPASAQKLLNYSLTVLERHSVEPPPIKRSNELEAPLESVRRTARPPG